ncbi:hypothetical protein J6TS7_55950 [Paenibacillus dendritiformis]|uniref:helix-turn-helix transcriptional regulator n=1 Tax=Paenibacillus TaxID=44249 RepID=UPI001B18730D|nr:hypothetical protein J6TS7_55950 [Paenibacillus dendritiformis]
MSTPKRIKLTNARIAKGLGRKQLAQILGISYEHIRSLEYGRVNPSIPLMFKICAELEDTPENLFDDIK